MFESFYTCGLMPHKHCLSESPLLMGGLTFSNSITVLQYFIIASFLFTAGSWGKDGGHWRRMCNALGLVFVFCSFNYIMQSVVIWYGCYFPQLIITWCGVLVSLKAIYHLIKIGRNALGSFMKALKITIKQSGL